MLAIACALATASCRSSSSPSDATSKGEYENEIALIADDPAVQFVPTGGTVDEVRERVDCIAGFDPVNPEYVRSFIFDSSTQSMEALAEEFRSAFADAGWDKVTDAPATEATRPADSIGLVFEKPFPGFDVTTSVGIPEPTPDGRGLTVYVVAGIDPSPCDF